MLQTLPLVTLFAFSFAAVVHGLRIRRRDLLHAGRNLTTDVGQLDLPLLTVLANADGIVPEDTACSAHNVMVRAPRQIQRAAGRRAKGPLIDGCLGSRSRIDRQSSRVVIGIHQTAGLVVEGKRVDTQLAAPLNRVVDIGQDTLIRPGTIIDRGARIGSDCVIGPHVHVDGSQTIADGTCIP